MEEFTQLVVNIIQNIPKRKVMTYGQIGTLAGNPWGARQVSRILHSMSDKYDLPWHRVINSKGEISLLGHGALEQARMLTDEGVVVKDFKIDLKTYLYEMV